MKAINVAKVIKLGRAGGAIGVAGGISRVGPGRAGGAIGVAKEIGKTINLY